MTSWNQMTQEQKTKMKIEKPTSQAIRVGSVTIATLYTSNVDTWIVGDIQENLEIYDLLEILKAFAGERKKRIKTIYFNPEYERFDVKIEDLPAVVNPR